MKECRAHTVSCPHPTLSQVESVMVEERDYKKNDIITNDTYHKPPRFLVIVE